MKEYLTYYVFCIIIITLTVHYVKTFPLSSAPTSGDSTKTGQAHIDGEITNYRAKTALMLRERDAFCGYLEQGIRGAHLLGSQKRRDEAMILYRDASLLWPDEKSVKALKDAFLEPKIT
jgi:hypothetical protein